MRAFLRDHNTIQIQRIFEGFHLIVSFDRRPNWPMELLRAKQTTFSSLDR